MSDPNWALIDQLSKRFDQLVGIAGQDQMRRLLDNFHVVHLIANGKFDEILNEYFIAKTQDFRRPGRLYEQLRHYELAPGRVKFLSALLETSGIVCDDRIHQMVVRKISTIPDAGRRLRCKLVRFDASVSLADVHGACRDIGLAPARLPNLIQFVDEYPDEVPDRLLGAGSASIPKRGDHGLVGIPSIARRKGDGRFDLTLHAVPGTDARAIDRTVVFLTERVALRDATDEAEPLTEEAGDRIPDEFDDVWKRLGVGA